MSKLDTWLAAALSVAASVLIAHAQDGGAMRPPTVPLWFPLCSPLPSKLDPPESRYCARLGEPIEERISRLEVALRLAKAEQLVSKRKRK